MADIQVNTNFDGGSIEVINITDCNNLKFKIRSDTNSHFRQWFYFELNNVANKQLNISLVEMQGTAYEEGWPNYNVVMSYDNYNWQRLASNYANHTLSFSIKPESKQVYFAYFEPYPETRHKALIDFAKKSPLIKHEVLGQTHEKRDLDLLIVGDQHAKTKIWFTARQHPGETMAEWFMEGLIHRLLESHDSVSRSLLQSCVFYLVPNMNPDGSVIGNLRVNKLGVNLNREWQTPSVKKSPEVYYVRDKMQQVGVDAFFDIHGDEEIPYVFTAGCEDNPSFSDKQKQAAEKFTKCLSHATPDYQTQYGYERGHFSTQTMTLGTNWVGNEFDCLAFTLEMPFKDHDDLPDSKYNFSGKRASYLGKSMLTALYGYLLK